jgi:hypothetical protein
MVEDRGLCGLIQVDVMVDIVEGGVGLVDVGHGGLLEVVEVVGVEASQGVVIPGFHATSAVLDVGHHRDGQEAHQDAIPGVGRCVVGLEDQSQREEAAGEGQDEGVHVDLLEGKVEPATEGEEWLVAVGAQSRIDAVDVTLLEVGHVRDSGHEYLQVYRLSIGMVDGTGRRQLEGLDY